MERYNKLNMIGKGTFGSVWLAESKASGNKYAVKELSVRTMSDTDRHLALNEVKILSTLKHKNIIRYKDAIHHGLDFFIVMEYAEGGDLYTKIKQSKGLFLQEQILDWLTQLLLALKHIHGFNILHRDLKTQNIFLTKSNVIKLGDFGIARILDSTTDHAQTTVGTPYYLSPEICQQQPYNQKSDMWALGCVMYEITALIPPFTADCFSSLVVKILHGKYTPIPRVYGPLLQDLIDVLLRANPQDRPTAKQLLYVPSMKHYVKKFAVIQREGNESLESNAVQHRKLTDKHKLKTIPWPEDANALRTQEISARRKKTECEENIAGTKSATENLEANQPASQVLEKKLMKHRCAEHITQQLHSENVVKERNFPIKKQALHPSSVQVVEEVLVKRQNAERIVKVSEPSSNNWNSNSEKSVMRSARANKDSSVSTHSNIANVEVTIHQEPKQTKKSQLQGITDPSEASANSARRQSVFSKPLDTAAADHIRQSILREHVKRRIRSVIHSTACDGGGHSREGSGRDQSCKKHTRIQSESAAQLSCRPLLKNKRLVTNNISVGVGHSSKDGDKGLEMSKSTNGKRLVPNKMSTNKILDPSPSGNTDRLIRNTIFVDRGVFPSQNPNSVRLVTSTNKGLEPCGSEHNEKLVTSKEITNERLNSHMAVNDNGPSHNPITDAKGVVFNHKDNASSLMPNQYMKDAPVSTIIDNCGLVNNDEINGVGLRARTSSDINGLGAMKGNAGDGLELRKSNFDYEFVTQDSSNKNGSGPYINSSPITDQTKTDQGAIPKEKSKLINQPNNIKETQSKNHTNRKTMSKKDKTMPSSKTTARQIKQSIVTQAKGSIKPSGSMSDTIVEPPDERNNESHQQLDNQVENCSKITTIDIHRTLAALKHRQALKSNRKMFGDEERSCRSRDRVVSVPGVRQARARRQAARESLEQHMHHCRRARKHSKRTFSRERLDKENLCPMVKNESGQFKAVAKRKSNVKPPQRLDIMVGSLGTFKRCETYKVAQFRRLPLMSVPDITNCAESNSENVPKSQQNKSRHRSDSSANPKLTFSKFKGIRGVQIDKARRRAKKIATNFGVESSRSEFSKKPDEASVEQQKSPKMSLKQDKQTETTSQEAKENSGAPESAQPKFNFRGKTLHLNSTDAKSTFARIEALRVFLEENLGTKRFIEAYQYLNGSSLFGNKNEVAKDDGGLESILGRYNIDYLPLLKQLIFTESKHFGTSV